MMFQLSKQRVTLCLSGAIALIGVVGCGGVSGPPLGYVTGKVKINDAPAKGVRLTFVPISNTGKGSPSYGATDQYGNYQLHYSQSRRGAQLGQHHVLIEAADPGTDENGRPLPKDKNLNLHPRYQQPGALVAQVSKGSNSLDFTLEARD